MCQISGLSYDLIGLFDDWICGALPHTPAGTLFEELSTSLHPCSRERRARNGLPAWGGIVAKPKSSANRKTGTKFRFLGFDYAGIDLIPLGVNSLTHVHGAFEPYVIW